MSGCVYSPLGLQLAGVNDAKPGMPPPGLNLEPWERRALGQMTAIRTFETGADRDVDDGKLDYEAFLSPAVLKRFAEYMHKNRVRKDGTLRDGDNWQKGIPQDVYMKSAWRHFFEWWELHRKAGRGQLLVDEWIEDTLCALMFNVMGYLHERLKPPA